MNLETPSSTVKRIVLTGGPSAGKTTALTYLYDHLSALGWRVILVPEAATIVLGATGRSEEERTGEYLEKAQHAILNFQKTAPKLLSAVLTGREEKIVYLHDRAELDNRAYVPHEIFEAVIAETHGMSAWEVAMQYDAVIHLVTAAEGAVEAYTTANNEARRESPEQARKVDEDTRQAWLGHSHYTVIPNHGSFDVKLRRTLQAVLQVVGEPEPLECERKWVVGEEPDLTNFKVTPVHIEQHYLTPPQGPEGPEVRIRARTVGKHTTHYRTVKTPGPDDATRVEHEVIISAETYHQLLAYRAQDSKPVVKTRYHFVHEGQHFELDHLISPVDLWLLEAELVQADQALTLPPFEGLTEVTGLKQYSNSQLARTVRAN